MSLPHDHQGVVHIVDDDEVVQRTIEAWLRRAALEARCYCSAEQFRATYLPAEVECVLLDMQLQGTSGLDLQATLNARHFQTPLVVISAYSDTATVVRAMRAGAVDFLEKPLDEESLLRAVLAALERDRETKTCSADLVRRLSQLTGLESEVLSLLVAAKTTAEIATALSIDLHAVEELRGSIFKKLEVGDVPALIWLVLGMRR